MGQDSGERVLERLADEAHQVWCMWMEYMFKQGFMSVSGNWVMDMVSYERWQWQMITPYAQLTDKEKESDREIAGRYLAIIMGGEVSRIDGEVNITELTTREMAIMLTDAWTHNVEFMELLESAWGIIANAYSGNWEDAGNKDWKPAAERWRDKYHALPIGEREEAVDDGD